MINRLKEMMNVELLQKLLNDFYRLFQIPISLTDQKDEIFLKAGYMGEPDRVEIHSTPVYLKGNLLFNILVYIDISNISVETMQITTDYIDNIICMISNLIEQQKESILLQSEQRYSKLFSNINQGMVVFLRMNDRLEPDRDFIILDANSAFEELMDTNKRKLIGKNLFEIKNIMEPQFNEAVITLIHSDRQQRLQFYSDKHNKYFEILTYFHDENEMVLLLSDVTNEQINAQFMRRQLINTVVSICSMIEKRDLYTAGHQKQVACLSLKIAQELKLGKESMEGLYIAARLHDIGKIGIPSEILTKPDKLTEIEYEMMKGHVQIAYDILKKIEFPWPVAKIVLQHHERLDGTGYPCGLYADDILMEAKILCVADVVEAIIAHRPYRPSLGVEYAMNEIQKYASIYYDPDVVKACTHVCEEHIWDIGMDESDMDLLYITKID